ncbi:MBL fold metallo-hydrolase [Protofrankia symbiont of Coriaria ruscifolia]|uniref:MBL fold metallo-hydrolase n=1 Tax=Protofrankia symbiont of Coriaria ruscifolia TaxID=1306542 RepID=UPI001F5E482C|nr:MBL fold metallo-hydrolase [Protofrankia symbiont of Coriaria ruscifolia]
MSLPAAAHQQVTAGGELREVADGVFAYIQEPGGWCVSNSGVLAGPDAVTLVDTAATEQRARGLAAAVAQVVRRPVSTIVNTHHHGDHLFGNAVFTPPATVIAHELARLEAARSGPALRAAFPDVEWGTLPPALPTVTFTDRLSLFVGELRVELIHVGPAHTTNDVIVWIPDRRVLFTGDVVLSGATPFCLMGSVAGTLRAVRTLRDLDAAILICGHGPPTGPAALDVTQAYLGRVLELAADGLAAGLTPLETALAAGPGPFADLLDPERLVANLHRAYAELRPAGHPASPDAAPVGVAPAEVARIPSGPVFAEMVAYNGGRPLTCLA